LVLEQSKPKSNQKGENNMTTEILGSFIVIIEWDGKRPPTKWYSRLERMGLKVAGDMEKSPLDRRSAAIGVIHQEGAIVVDNESSARILGHLAYELGARAVSVGTLHLSELEMSTEDTHALNRIQSVLGKRGRPTAAKQIFAVTCHDCLCTTEYEGFNPINCPKCGSFKIEYRLGTPVLFKSIDKNWKGWVASRFSTSSFEIPTVDTTNGIDLNLAGFGFVNGENERRVKFLKDSDLAGALAKVGSKLTDNEKLRVLDFGYKVLGLTKEDRQARRFEGMAAYFQAGGKQNGYMLTAEENNVDMFDIYRESPEIVSKLF
jgi:hypothetical protein